MMENLNKEIDMSEQNNEKVIVRAASLSKEFKDFWGRPKAKAVNEIDFEVKEGEVLGLLGPNGSGKSTTVKMLLGLLYPTSGNLRVFNQSPQDVITKKFIGYLPEESYLYKYLTAEETLDFFGALFNLSLAERKHRTTQLLDMVGLSHAARRPVGEFSKGMQRRIGLAQAMINDPDLLILDEPTSGLDPIGCKEIKDLIRLLKQRGKTVLITSHLLGDVEDICDRVIILYGGKIRASGTLNELLTVPDANRITTPLLTPDVTEKVLAILRNELKGEDFSIDQPRKTLEDFFLEVINKAKDDSIETSGVVNSGHIADYLQQEADQHAILENLTKDEMVEKADRNIEEKAIEQETQPEKINSEKLSELTEEKEEGNIHETDASEQAQGKLTEANKKLADLLSDKQEK